MTKERVSKDTDNVVAATKLELRLRRNKAKGEETSLKWIGFQGAMTGDVGETQMKP